MEFEAEMSPNGDKEYTCENINFVNETLPVTLNFDASNPIGKAKNLKVEDGKITCDIKIKDKDVIEKIRGQSSRFVPAGFPENQKVDIDNIGLVEDN